MDQYEIKIRVSYAGDYCGGCKFRKNLQEGTIYSTSFYCVLYGAHLSYKGRRTPESPHRCPACIKASNDNAVCVRCKRRKNG